MRLVRRAKMERIVAHRWRRAGCLPIMVGRTGGDDVVIVLIDCCVDSGEAVEGVDAIVDVWFLEVGFDMQVQKLGRWEYPITSCMRVDKAVKIRLFISGLVS